MPWQCIKKLHSQALLLSLVVLFQDPCSCGTFSLHTLLRAEWSTAKKACSYIPANIDQIAGGSTLSQTDFWRRERQPSGLFGFGACGRQPSVFNGPGVPEMQPSCALGVEDAVSRSSKCLETGQMPSEEQNRGSCGANQDLGAFLANDEQPSNTEPCVAKAQVIGTTELEERELQCALVVDSIEHIDFLSGGDLYDLSVVRKERMQLRGGSKVQSLSAFDDQLKVC